LGSAVFLSSPASSPEIEVPASDPNSRSAPPQFGETWKADTSLPAAGAYFCGDTSFLSLALALRTIAKEKLSGTLRLFWNRDFCRNAGA